MVKRAPSRFNPDLLARDATRYEAEVPLSQFPRLTELLLSSEGSVMASFGINQRDKQTVIRGSLNFDAVMQCQRCMDNYSFPVAADFELVCVVSEEAANALPDALDPVVLDDEGQLHLVDLLEDDALLQLPDIPKHTDDAVCRPDEHSFGDIPESATTKKPNPFGVLKDLKLS